MGHLTLNVSVAA
jgi:hypothetical protein